MEMNEEVIEMMDEIDIADQYNRCPRCGVLSDKHPQNKEGEFECDQALLIKHAKPRFYMMDLNNYVRDFLIEIIEWQAEKIDYLENKGDGDKQ